MQGYAPIAFPSSEVWSHLQVGVPGIFLFLVLLALPEAKLTVGRVVGRDTPPVPSLPATLVRAAVFVPAVALLASVAGDNLGDLTRALIYATLLLSLVLLTGYSGQISLAQYVFFGLGAFAMGKVAGRRQHPRAWARRRPSPCRSAWSSPCRRSGSRASTSRSSPSRWPRCRAT